MQNASTQETLPASNYEHLILRITADLVRASVNSHFNKIRFIYSVGPYDRAKVLANVELFF